MKHLILLSCNDLTKYFGINLILNKISFTIQENQKVGIIGKNGAGKTTLFKIIMGTLPYDEGQITLGKDKTIGYLEQTAAYHSDMTLYDSCLSAFENLVAMEKQMRFLEHEIADPENEAMLSTLMDDYSELTDQFEKLNGYAYRSELKGILMGLGFTEADFDRKINTFSGGQKTRVNIAKLLLRKPDLLLLDEPTNHLDISATQWLENYLKNYDGSVIIISHDRYFLDEIIDKVIEVRNQKVFEYNGNYTKFVKQKEDNYEFEMRQYEKQQKEISKEENLIKSFKERGTEKLAKRARSREKRLANIEVVHSPESIEKKKAKISFSTRIKSGQDVLLFEDLSKSYDGKNIFENTTADIFKEDRIGLIGDNGVGKTTLFRILLKEETYDEGKIFYGHNVHLGYYDQDQSNLNYGNNLIEEISDAYPKLDTTEIRGLLGSFLFIGDEVFNTVKNLSGGEKGRISLLKLMLSESNTLLLDEPTNHLDIESKEALEAALLNYDGTIIAISHDRYFLNKICNRTFELTPKGINSFLGNYDYYIEKKLESKIFKAEATTEKITKTKTQLKDDRKKEKELAKQKREAKKAFEDIETEIHTLETEQESIEHQLCDEAVFSNPEKTLALTNRIDTIKSRLSDLYDLWEEHEHHI